MVAREGVERSTERERLQWRVCICRETSESGGKTQTFKITQKWHIHKKQFLWQQNLIKPLYYKISILGGKTLFSSPTPPSPPSQQLLTHPETLLAQSGSTKPQKCRGKTKGEDERDRREFLKEL